MFYKNLDLIGFRLIEDPYHPITHDKQNSMYQHRYVSYIFYMLSAMYFHSFYDTKFEESEFEHDWSETKYKEFFEFSMITSFKGKGEKEKEAKKEKEQESPAGADEEASPEADKK